MNCVLRGVKPRIVPEEGVAPTVERWTPNPTVAGSNPVALIFLIFFTFPLFLEIQPSDRFIMIGISVDSQCFIILYDCFI